MPDIGLKLQHQRLNALAGRRLCLESGFKNESRPTILVLVSRVHVLVFAFSPVTLQN